MIKRFPVYKQLEGMDCGPTCLRMVSAFYGKHLSLQKLRALCSVSRLGVSIQDIAIAAENIGFRTLPAKMTLATLADEAPLPAIIHWQKKHFAVVIDVSKKHVRLADPSFGLLKVPHKDFLIGWTGTTDSESEGMSLLLEPTPQFDSSEDQDRKGLSLFKHIWEHLKPYRKYSVQLLSGILAASIIQLFFPFLTQAIVDHGIYGRDLGFIGLILAAQLALFLGRTVGDVLRSRILLHVGSRTAIAMRSAFLHKITRLPLKFFDDRLVGDINTRLSDHYEIERLLTETITPSASAILNLIVFSAILVWYDLRIFAVFSVGSVLYMLWVSYMVVKRRNHIYRSIRLDAQMHDIIIQLIHGIQELKLYCAEQFARWRWERSQSRLFNVRLKQLTIDQLQSLGGGFINELKNIIITFMAARLVVTGDITLGMMLAVQYIVGQLNAPISDIQNLIQMGDRARVSLERIQELTVMKDEESGTTKGQLLSESNGDIMIENISFRYAGPTSPEVLRDISMRIPEGKITAIVGVSGSGKTTLIKLLLRFYDPLEGDIHVGATDLATLQHKTWRKLCSGVLQDGYIFNDTIAGNIALGEEVVDIERLIYAAKVANIYDYVKSQPYGFDRPIGGEGQGLSGGEKQRILIARAVYADPQYLFFDEATNSLDANNEREIMMNLNKFFISKTVIIVAHRLSTVMNADQIVVLDKGKIVERGNHQELTKLRGHYFQLVKNQLELGQD